MAIEKAQVSLSQILKKPIFVKYTSPSRVGTVDKFQGQETEIVIVSMTTSSQEYLPRHMDFLFSRKRLNVALSRGYYAGISDCCTPGADLPEKFCCNIIPDHCPRCHHGIKPTKIGANVIKRREIDGGSTLQIVYRCPRDECQRAFIATYWQNRGYRTHYPEGDYLLRNTAPYSA